MMMEMRIVDFRESGINKILKVLEENEIDYVSKGSSDDEKRMEFGSRNRYKEFFEVVRDKMEIKRKINRICRYLNDSEEEQIMISKISQVEKILFD